MKTAKTTSTPKRTTTVRALINPPLSHVRRVNRDKLNRLAGCWPAAEANRIAAFIEENCEAAHEGQ